jgi:hypothetical protein
VIYEVEAARAVSKADPIPSLPLRQPPRGAAHHLGVGGPAVSPIGDDSAGDSAQAGALVPYEAEPPPQPPRKPTASDYVCLGDATGGVGTTFGYFPLKKAIWRGANPTTAPAPKSASAPDVTASADSAAPGGKKQQAQPSGASKQKPKPLAGLTAWAKEAMGAPALREKSPLVTAVIRGRVGGSSAANASAVDALLTSVTRPDDVAKAVGDKLTGPTRQAVPSYSFIPPDR